MSLEDAIRKAEEMAGAPPAPEPVARPALQPCRTCERQVATDAASCPGCGAPDPTGTAPAAAATVEEESVKSSSDSCLFGCLALFLLPLLMFVVIGVASAIKGDDDGGDSDGGVDAATIERAEASCRSAAAVQLKFPETADFDLDVYGNQADSLRVRGEVTAKNAFGVPSRYVVSCVRGSNGQTTAAVLPK